GYLLLERLVGARGAVHRPHAAGADQLHDLIGAEARSDHPVGGARRGGLLIELVARLFVRLDQRSDLVQQLGVAGANAREIRRALGGREPGAPTDDVPGFFSATQMARATGGPAAWTGRPL